MISGGCAGDLPDADAVVTVTPVRGRSEAEWRRHVLFEMLQPVKLANCELERFGEVNDGGYLLCANLLKGVQSGYSYGISGYDKWGCDVSKRLSLPVHQYDCFDLTRPVCQGGRTIFHEECVGGSRETIDKRPYDTMASQLQKNGDAGKHVVMKMDVEGSEWDSFINAPEELLARIDQLAIELHGIGEDRFRTVITHLKRHFYLVNVHYNNHTCDGRLRPFPALVYEALFVNKRIGVLDPTGKPDAIHRLNQPNHPTIPDCQPAPPETDR